MFTTLTAANGTLLHAFWKGPLSNWAPRAISIDGVRYPNGEARIMVAKAELFGDAATLAAMRKTSDPQKLKALGREVAGFRQAIWDAMRPVISRDLLLHKLAQHPDIREAVLGAPPGRFVEASPYDGLWGVKLDVTDPRLLDPTQWQGLNYLGEDYDAVVKILR